MRKLVWVLFVALSLFAFAAARKTVATSSIKYGTEVQQIGLISDNYHTTALGDFGDLQVDNPAGPTATATFTATKALHMPFIAVPPLTSTSTATPTAIPTITATPTITPTPDDGGGQIVFTSSRDGNQEIYSMNFDGSEQTRLTNNTARDFEPAWSPDGAKIAFVSDRDSSNDIFNPEIYVMNADGTEQTRLTNNETFDVAPSWSPDGSKIAFERWSRTNSPPPGINGPPDIYVMNADGTGLVNLTNSSTIEFNPAWSPDGSKIAFDRGNDIFVMNVDSSEVTQLTTEPGRDFLPAWSPDGTKIVYVHEEPGNLIFIGEIYIMNADGSGISRLTNHPADDTFPAWSPDGTRIVFSSNRDGNREIYVMNVDGSGLTRLTNDPASDFQPSWHQ